MPIRGMHAGGVGWYVSTCMHGKPGVCREESRCLGESAVLGAILGAVLGEARPLEEPSQRRAGRLDELVQRHDEHLARAIKGGHQW